MRVTGTRGGCIGPAGENLIRAAMLVNDYNHIAATVWRGDGLEEIESLRRLGH